jgi:glycosidase
MTPEKENTKNNKCVIYQTLPRLFGNYNNNLKKNGSIKENGCGKLNSYTNKALKEIKSLGATHIWYTGIIRHATLTDYSEYQLNKEHSAIVKGIAGSPYSIKDYYDVCPDLAENIPDRMCEFEDLIERTHNEGLKVIIDFIPNHVSRNYRSRMKPPFIADLGQNDNVDKAFSINNNFYYLPNQYLKLPVDQTKEDFEYSELPARVTGNNCFTATPGVNDWYETIKLNYGIDYMNNFSLHFNPVPDTWQKMLDILLFWANKNIDGFRCDMVELVPVEFWAWAIPQVKSKKNICFIAEIYNPGVYREYLFKGKFDYLYDKAGIYDTIRNIICKRSPLSEITKRWHETEDLEEKMLLFLENHDEQRLASDFFAGYAGIGIPAFALISLMNNNPVMIYNGQEVGERGMDEEGFSGRDGRTTIFDYWSMDSVRKWANNGRFDGGLLSDEQLIIRNKYGQILNLICSEETFSKGQFYDLNYCNKGKPHFPSDVLTCFLRKYNNVVILVAVNFDHQEHSVFLNIPQNAFEVLKIEDNKASISNDMISGEKGVSALTCKCPFNITIDKMSFKVLKFIY